MERLRPFSTPGSQQTESAGLLAPSSALPPSPLGLAWDHPDCPMPDPRTGKLLVDPDIVLKAQKFNLDINFYYSSEVLVTFGNEFGFQRGASVNQLIENIATPTEVRLHRGDFSQYVYVQTGGGYAAATAGAICTYLLGDYPHITETFPDGSTQTFKKNPVLPWSSLNLVTDASGVTQTYTYDNTTGFLDTIEVPGERFVSFSYASDQLASITDWSGRAWTFQYDAGGALTTYMQPNGCISQYAYTFISSTMLWSITDPRGYLTTYTYGDEERIASMAQGSAVWNYNFSTTTLTDAWTNVVAPSGAVTTYNFDTSTYNIGNVQRPEGYTTTYTYDSTSGFRTGEQIPSGWQMSVISNNGVLPMVTADALGNITTYEYDSNQNLTTYIDATGATTTFAYDGSRNRIGMTDPLGRVTSYSYDAFGQLISTTDPRGLVTTNAYDVYGNLASVMSSDGGITTYGYDLLNRVTTMTDPIGRTTTYAYDPADNLISTTDPTGAVTGNIYSSCLLQAKIDPLGFRTTYSYDRFSNLVSATNALGQITTYNYNSLGYQVSMMEANGNVSSSNYNTAMQKIADIDALGFVTTYAFDTSGRLVSTMNARGFISTSVFDADNRVIASVDALGNRTTSSYDAVGRVVSMQDARGFITTTLYDAAGQKTTQIDQLGTVTTYAYNPDSQVVAISNPFYTNTNVYFANSIRLQATQSPDNYRVTNSYDLAGQLLSAMNARGYVTTYSYDPDGRRLAVQDALGNLATNSYNPRGNLVSTVDANGAISTTNYDALGRVASTQNAVGAITTTQYDSVGNRTTMTDAAGSIWTTVYDPLNRMFARVDPLGFRSTYSYDPVGNQISMVNARSYVTTQSFDAVNRLVSTQDALGFIVGYGYDAVGNRTTIQDANGNYITSVYDGRRALLAIENQDGFATSYSYDLIGRKVVRQFPNLSLTTYGYDLEDRMSSILYGDGTWITYQYDPNSNLTTASEYGAFVSSDPSATTVVTTMTFDALDRTAGRTNPGSLNQAYSYDAVGNRTELVAPDGGVRTMSYDLANRLIAAQTPVGAWVSYTYDLLDRRTQQISSSPKMTVNRVYDAESQILTLQQLDSSGTQQQAFTYSYDAIGNRIGLTDANGSLSAYSYDAKDRLVSSAIAGTNAANYAYSYDQVDNILTNNESGGILSFTYDPASRIVTSVSINGTTTYTYDANGNRTLVNDPVTGLTSMSYDHENRLIANAQSDGTIASYSYDSFGMKRSENNAGAVTTLVWDRQDYLCEIDPASAYNVMETPTPVTNGSTTVFDLAGTPLSGGETVFVNGVAQENGAGDDYTLSGNAITMATAPAASDKLRVSYFTVAPPALAYVRMQVPSPTPTGTATTFTLPSTPDEGSVTLMLNGVTQDPGPGNDYQISGATVYMAVAPASGALLLASYFETSASSALTFVRMEAPSPNPPTGGTTFTLANTPASGTETVYLNGIAQNPGAGNDYTISGNTITMAVAPASSDKVRVTYYH